MAKILVVDDEVNLAEILQVRLGNLGHEVDLCFNGGQALEKITIGNYDLLIMDYFMPSLKGDMVCRSIRENEISKHLPILIMTAFTHYETSFFIENGANDVLFKPFDKDVLFEKVNRLLGEKAL